MPATDAYFRNLKKMHVWFAVSSVAMLAVTVWMMGDDHSREYFRYQQTFEHIQVLQAEARIDAIRTKQFERELQALRLAVSTAEKELASRSEEAEQLKQELKTRELKFTLAEATLKLLNSQLTEAAAIHGLAVRDAKPQAEIDALVRVYDTKKGKVDEQVIVVEESKAVRDKTQGELKDLTRSFDDATAKRDDKLKEINLLRKAKLKLEPDSTWKWVKRKTMEWPVLQGFNSHLKIHQDWLPKLEIKLGMTSSARFDRCRTCHLGIDKVGAGNVPTFPHGGEAPAHGHATDEQIAEWVTSNRFPQPYSTHPNPDLYLTANSPHPTATFGCTICHDGNGSGTSFRNAEHGPNTPHQARTWKKKHHYHANHFWEYPMQSRRLLESTCIKCHHHMEELGRSPKFGATAPKVFGGYRLVQKFGCFGCHDIHGFERGKSIGPDLRTEPNYTESALQFRWLAKQHGSKLDAVAEHLNHIINFPEESAEARAKLTDWIRKDIQARADALKKIATQRNSDAKRTAVDAAHLSAGARAMVEQFKDYPHPGKYRKVGPSLRYIKSKTSREFIAYWTEEPKRFRPSTRMPQFFKLTNQHDEIAKQLTPVQIAGIAQYLHDKSQKFNPIALKPGYKPDVKRGKMFFAQKGCLACHSHRDTKKATADFGPDLSRIAAKVKRDPGNPAFSAWLYTWIREPRRYHSRTKMPYLFLTEEDFVEGGQRIKVDPAADITAYLLQLNDDTKTLLELFRGNADEQMLTVDNGALNDLVALYVVGKTLTDAQFKAFMTSRKYPVAPAQIKGDEIEFLRGKKDPKDNDEWTRRRLNYVGRKTISQYGCYGCHDVPGFERARSIGTTLQNYGRKDRSQLAFEHIKEYLHHHGEPDGSSTQKRVELAMKQAASGAAEKDPARDNEMSAAYFYDSLLHHNRSGFVWQKLRDPRSYDYEKLQTKGFDERLRMPKFPITEREVEQIATFILGLVAEPPPEQYQYRPKGPAYDRVEGERLLRKYNCTSCHMTDLPSITYWADLKERPSLYPANLQPGQPQPLGADLLKQLMPPRKVNTSVTTPMENEDGDKVPHTRITFRGLPVFDPDEDPVGDNSYYFENWEHLDVNGRLVRPSQGKISFGAKKLVSLKPGRGGDFAEWLFRHLKGQARIENDTGDRVRHQLPPVLYREGHKVQTPWLYQFLRNPVKLRPMTVLRMPRFSLSREDAQILANYFAAVDGVPYPYQNVPQRTPGYLAKQETAHRALFSQAKHPDYLSQGWKMLANPKLCRQCHTVGGYPGLPPADPKKVVQGPSLKHATDRLRPEWLLLWTADPRWITPYTAMPVNFDVTKKSYPESFGGNAAIQWKAVRDALMNYHRLMELHKKTEFQYPAPPKKTTGGPPKPNRQPPENNVDRNAVLQASRNDKRLELHRKR